MKIAQVYSHLNGLEYLLVHRRKLWREIQTVIGRIDAGGCKTKVSEEKGMKGRMLYSPKAMNRAFHDLLRERDWQESRVGYWVTADARLIRRIMIKPADQQKAEIAATGARPIYSYNQTDFVKDRVALEVQFGKYSFAAYDLFVKHLAFFVGDQIDVGIEILPMKVLQEEMSSGPGYYEGELFNVIRNGRGVPAVPLVIVGVQP